MPRKGEIVDLSGRRFGRLAVLSWSHQARRCSYWLCACDCGNEKTVLGGSLRNGHSQSCGCLRSEMVATKNEKHGHSVRGARSPEYESWHAMRARVNITSGKTARSYSARGITICAEWESFDRFLADMGPRPDGTTLDRKDNDGNYEPGNCRWATHVQQANNRRPRTRSPQLTTETAES